MKRTLCLLVAALAEAATMMAQTPEEGTSIIQEKDTVWSFGLEGINLYERKMHRIDIAYDTKDPEGNACRMSGVIIIPKDVYDGEQICDGTVLMHHYTQMAKKDAPSRGYNQGEDLVLANPLSPNYIMVLPDFYGFGITEDKDQWYCYGTANAHPALDCLLAAQELLKERGIEQGQFLISAGYSSGGYDAIATQKVRDMEYKDRVSFDHIIVGGLPFDLKEAYYQFVTYKDQFWRVFGLLLVVDSYNHHANLGFTPEQMLKSPFAEKFEDWVHSGNYTTTDIMKEVQGLSLSDVFQEPFLTLNSDEYKKVTEALEKVALKKDWVPDPTQKYSVFHLYKDATVPVSSGRALLSFLSGYEYKDGQENPFKKSIIPEQTNLTTDFIIPNKDHSLAGGIMYYIGLTAMMTALPVLYYDGELNTHYADLVKGLTPMEIAKTLNEKYNLKAMIRERMEEGGGSTDIFSLLAQITNTVDGYLQPYELDFSDLIVMADDSGLSLEDIFSIYNYLTAPEESANNVRSFNGTRKSKADDRQQMSPFLTDYYINYLTNWYKKAK